MKQINFKLQLEVSSSVLSLSKINLTYDYMNIELGFPKVPSLREVNVRKYLHLDTQAVTVFVGSLWNWRRLATAFLGDFFASCEHSAS